MLNRMCCFLFAVSPGRDQPSNPEPFLADRGCHARSEQMDVVQDASLGLFL